MTKTKIEWADSVFNPITGCLNSCEYCYARKIAKRFEGMDYEASTKEARHATEIYKHKVTDECLFETSISYKKITKSGKKIVASYPFGFQPTFHRYRLD